jgi:hypothetical protein
MSADLASFGILLQLPKVPKVPKGPKPKNSGASARRFKAQS